MATINEFEKIYKETSGPTILIGCSKKTGKWFAHEVNKKIRFEADNHFALFDKLIKYMKERRTENQKKYKL